ncbi:MAG: murein biosynthesis integral membrane protein MurJ [Chloroflexi bacterium]|nr:murein biosynthesis integral membrane protein MurJ [Chloroflexota bacterium]
MTLPPPIARLLDRLPPGALLLSVLTFGSYLMGLARDRVFARTFGASSDLDVYNAALVLPELVLDVLVLAGLTAAFVPVFLRTEQDDATAGAEFARTVLTTASVVMGVGVVVLAIIAPVTVELVAPGFDAQQRELYTSLFRQMCLSALVFAISFAVGELLVARQRFLAYGVAPLLYNLGIVLGALLLGPSLGIEGVAIGTLVGAFLHLGVRVVASRRITPRLGISLAVRTVEFREYLRLSVPRAIAQPIEAVTFLFFTRVASGMAEGSVSAVSFARNFQSVPVSLIGIAFSVAAFPVLSRIAASGDRSRFARVVRDDVLIIGLLSAAAGLALALVAELAIRILLGGGAFDEEDIATTAGLLVVFAISVPLESLVHVLARSVYATRQTLLPVLASVSGLVVIVVTVLAFEAELGLVAVPLAFAAGMAVRVVILVLALRWRIRHLPEVAATR